MVWNQLLKANIPRSYLERCFICARMEPHYRKCACWCHSDVRQLETHRGWRLKDGPGGKTGASKLRGPKRLGVPEWDYSKRGIR